LETGRLLELWPGNTGAHLVLGTDDVMACLGVSATVTVTFVIKTAVTIVIVKTTQNHRDVRPDKLPTHLAGSSRYTLHTSH